MSETHFDPTIDFMYTKINPSKTNAYANAEPNEPIFTLIGRDPDAALIVHIWATLRLRQIRIGMLEDTVEERDQISEAISVSQEMSRYSSLRATKKLAERITFNDRGYPLTIDGYPIEQQKKGS